MNNFLLGFLNTFAMRKKKIEALIQSDDAMKGNPK